MRFTTSFRSRMVSMLPLFVFLLCVLQPLMDILSYWMAALSLSNLPTLILRFSVFALTLLFGLCLSDRKRFYYLVISFGLLLGLGHMFAARQAGYRNMFTDLTNYIRVLQMPLTVLCFVTFLRKNRKCDAALKNGLLAALLVILAAELLATATHTELHTYSDGTGYMGWFRNTNSQSAILSMLVPVASAWLYEKRGFKSPLFWLVTLGGFSALYFFGTRLCILGLAAAGFGLGISLLLTCRAAWKRALALFAVTLTFLGLLPFSPMSVHQASYETVQAQRQDSLSNLIHMAYLPSLKEEGLSPEELAHRKELWVNFLTPIYTTYTPDFVEYFGIERTISMYDYSYDIRQLTATRPKKLQFARLLMADASRASHLFGIELDRFTINGNIYDVENDLHGIYFLYGYVGLFSMLAFLLYFLLLILSALFRDPKRYFTLDTAAWGIALALCLAHVFFTAGVLRRPNASFYLSAILAALYDRIKSDPAPAASHTLSHLR